MILFICLKWAKRLTGIWHYDIKRRMKDDSDMSGYIMDLRRIVGHRTLMQCAASIIVENEKGQILLGKRTDNHMWSYSGGSVEIDEKVEAAAKRELLEEMGLVADSIEFFMVNSGPEVHYIYPNGDEVSNIEIIYICNQYHGEIKAQKEEMEQLRFFDPAEIDLEMISPPTRPVIQKYIEEKNEHLFCKTWGNRLEYSEKNPGDDRYTAE